MEEITVKITAEYKAFIALVGYSYLDNYYFESHPIDDKGRIKQGKPMDHNTMDKLLNSFDPRTEKKVVYPEGPIPSVLRYVGIEKKEYIWSCPGVKRMLYFKDKFIGNGEAYVPDMVFHTTGNSLSVFVIKDTRSGNPELFLSPFPNCYVNGGVCQGSAKAKRAGNKWSDIMTYWEDIFWKSEFSHTTSDKVYDGNITLLWKEQIKTGGVFPLDNLISANKKLEDLWKK